MKTRHLDLNAHTTPRVACFRCGVVGRHQFQISPDGNLYRPLCPVCSKALRAMVLKWLGFADWKERLEKVQG